jgi:hypothetical protein
MGEVTAAEVGFDSFKICHIFGDDSGSISGATELKGFLDHTFELLLQMKQVFFFWLSGLLGVAYFFARDCLLTCCGLGTKRIRVRDHCPEGVEKLWVVTSLVGGFQWQTLW